jgi:hypothetical protein
MTKPRSDSAWRRLTPEQKETLEGWLFEESLGYREVLERAQKEFGVTASIPSLAGYYQRLARERKFNRLAEAKDWALDAAADTPKINDVLDYAVRNLIGVTVYEMAVEGPEKVKVKEIGQLMKLLLQNRQIAVREGHLAVREGHLALEKDRLHMEDTYNGAREMRAQTKATEESNKHKIYPGDLRRGMKILRTEMEEHFKPAPTPEKPPN